ncbi:MAG: hypothetical protein ACK4G4_10840 [Thermus sp.]|uniref:hypothetical protein n=1 Tax=Thermus sp. TaxID=275 RepID=UPI00391DB365
MRKVGTLLTVVGILAIGLVVAQPQTAPVPPTPPSAPGAPAFPQMGPVTPGAYADYRLMEGATREIYRATYAQSVVRGYQLVTQPTWLALGDQLLSAAQGDLQGQRYFAARERARAARLVYEAALELNGIFYPAPGPRGPRGPRGFDPYREAYRAQERVSVLEAEISYYRNDDPRVRTLLDAAKGLLGNNPWMARKLADAGHHLIRAERGF